MTIKLSSRRFLHHSTGRRCYQVLLLLLSVWGSGCTPLIMTPTPAAPLSAPVDVRLIVQVTYPTVEVLNALAGELDIWEVDRTAQTLVARVTLEQYDALLQQQLPVALDCAKMHQYAQALHLTEPTVAALLRAQCPE